jgi:hypothetical protein
MNGGVCLMFHLGCQFRELAQIGVASALRKSERVGLTENASPPKLHTA